MAYPYGIGPNPYVTSIWTSNLTQECMHKHPPTRVGFDSQWALPMSCCFCMFCSSSLGILNQATQDVLSGRVGSLCPLLSCLDATSFVISNDYCTLP